MLLSIFGEDNRGKAVAWSLFGKATAIGRQHSDKSSSLKSISTTIDNVGTVIGNGAKLTSVVATVFGNHKLALRADSVHRRLLK
jgi:hypothetical protein